MIRKTPLRPLALLSLISLSTIPIPMAAASSTPGFMESWYISRAQSNMSIGNYKAAIEAYEKVIEKNPRNVEAMRSLGVAYERQGLKDKSVAQFDRYLEQNPKDADIAFKQANTLGWDRYSYRRKDALKYYEMGLKVKNDPKERLKYALLLSQDKGNSAEAIRQYRMVLAKEPRNPQAHSGLARAYAWNGLNDQALHESNLAMTYGHSRTDISGVRQDLMKGREPSAGGHFNFLTQSGTGFEMNGVTSSLRGRNELGPFVTARADAGVENYWDPSRSEFGPFFSAGMQYRLDPAQRIEGEIGYHHLGGYGGTRNVTFNGHYTYQNGETSLTPGFKRELMSDTLLSLAGQGTGNQLMGSARSHVAYAEVEFPMGWVQTKVTPYVGWVSTASLSPNAKMGVDARAELPLVDRNGFDASFVYSAQLSHYGSDQSGAGGGYFSPQFFANQVPGGMMKYSFGGKNEVELTAGPSLQFVSDKSTSGAFRLGADVQANYLQYLGGQFVWNANLSFNQVSSIYNRFQAGSGLSYIF